MGNARQIEIDLNYDFFQRNLATFLVGHQGQYALLKDATVVEWFDRPGDAYRAGLARFGELPFSIQEVDDRPADLGLGSLALD